MKINTICNIIAPTTFQMHVSKDSGKEDENALKKKLFSRRLVEMEKEDMKRCKLDCMLVKCWSRRMLTVSDEVAKATLETLRGKREDHLKMVREIKEIQYAGTEKMAKFAK